MPSRHWPHSRHRALCPGRPCGTPPLQPPSGNRSSVVQVEVHAIELASFSWSPSWHCRHLETAAALSELNQSRPRRNPRRNPNPHRWAPPPLPRSFDQNLTVQINWLKRSGTEQRGASDHLLIRWFTGVICPNQYPRIGWQHVAISSLKQNSN
jgi:hypothetical protein